MSYKTKEEQADYGHRWYLAHKTLTNERSRINKKAWRDRRKALVLNPVQTIPETEAEVAPQPMTEEEQWFDSIRIGICKGVSTNTLSAELHHKFWDMLKARIVGKIGTALFEQATKGKYDSRCA